MIVSINGMTFSSFSPTSRGDCLVSISDCADYFMKIQVNRFAQKKNSLFDEFAILKYLQQKSCQTCVEPIWYGEVDIQTGITREVRDSEYDSESSVDTVSNAMITRFVENVGSTLGHYYDIPDLILAVAEQRAMGIFHNDVKPDNVGYDHKRGIVVFIDYDQAEIFKTAEEKGNLKEFLTLCDQYDANRYGIGNWLRHFKCDSNVCSEFFTEKGQFDLGTTRVFKEQKTTNTTNGLYHKIDDRDFYLDGPRSNIEREKILDRIEFSPEERVLDVGCNSGIVSQYLSKRNCRVVGIDNDKKITIAAQILANCQGHVILFDCVDLDMIDELPEFDTICLFSVLHHTRNVKRSARIVGKSCKRIILEARPVENGKQPDESGNWVDTSKWNYRNLESFIEGMVSLFPDFKLNEEHVATVDKSRMILQLIKTQ